MESSKTFLKCLLVLTVLALHVSSQEYLSSLDRAGLRGLSDRHPSHGMPFRRMDCAVFCRKTGFTGLAGGCNCGFTLFTAKRSGALEPGADEQEDPMDLYHVRAGGGVDHKDFGHHKTQTNGKPN